MLLLFNHALFPVIPSDVTPVPGQPINPEDPNSPVWPESVKELTTSEEVTRTITYVDEDGKEVTTSVTSSVKFTRDAKVNLVTGEVTYGEWKEATIDVLSGNKLPFVKGYIAVSGDIEASTRIKLLRLKTKISFKKLSIRNLEHGFQTCQDKQILHVLIIQMIQTVIQLNRVYQRKIL